MIRLRWWILLLLGTAAAFSSRLSFEEHAAVQESLGNVEPWQRRQWLAERGLQDYYKVQSWRPTTDSGLRCVGRWSYGPSVKVSLRATADDTIVCLARGSGASLIRFRSHDSLTLQLLSDLNCNGLVSRAVIKDSLVYCGMNEGGAGIEVWDVGDLSTPRRLSYVYLPSVEDIAVKDTFLYSIGYQQDYLRIFNVANPSSPVQVGACADSGINGMCVAGNYCYLADQYGLYVDDVSNPTNPHRVAAVGGYEALAVTVRDTLCYVGTYDGTNFALQVYDVTDPSMPFPVGSLSGIEAHDLYLPPTCDTVLYTPKLHVINITNPASPRQVGFVDCPGWDYGVVAVPALGEALVADYFKGMVAVSLHNPTAPLVDTMTYAGDQALDITFDNGKAYLASYHAGLQILDVSDPSRPSYLGCYDTAGTAGVVRSATAKDSFAYISWPMPRILSIDVADPHHPIRAAGCDGMFGYPDDMVTRDSLVYCAESRRLQVVNVARPREPVLVGSCVLPYDSYDMDLQDTLAYVANLTSLQIVSVAHPDSPRAVGTWAGNVDGVDVADTIAYVTGNNYSVYSLSVSDPASPYELDSAYFGQIGTDVTIVGSRAYVSENVIHVVDVADPRNLRLVAAASVPYWTRRIVYAAPYLYACCAEAGVAIYETTAVGVQEPKPRAKQTARPVPTVVRGAAWKSLTAGAVVFDAMGRRVTQAKPGVYFVLEAQAQAQAQAVLKVVLVQ